MKSVLAKALGAVLLPMLFLHPVPAAAQAPQATTKTVTWTLPTLVGADTLQLRGYRPTVALEFTLPPGWQPLRAPGAAQLRLEYRVSELARPGASLTVRLNGQSLTSTAFDERSGTLTLDLPSDLLRLGRNALEFAAFLPLEEDRECIVPNHPARWLEFGPESRLRATIAPGALNLADFPALFDPVGDAENTRLLFVVPDGPSERELNALATVASGLGRGAATQRRWVVVPASRFDPEAVAAPTVLIGVAGRNPHLDALAPPEGAGTGWLRLTRTEWSKGEPVLAVGGADGEALLRAARALVDPLALLQLEGEAAVIDQLPPAVPRPSRESFTLADLGYGERVVRGPGEQSLIYAFDLPLAWSPAEGRLTLHFVSSPVLDPRAANLTVYLNGRTVAGVRLDAPQAVEVPLPARLMRPGRNFLRLTFDLGLPIELCDFGSVRGLWAAVRPDTALTLPHADRGGRLDLDDFPYLFAAEVDRANLAFILPAESTAEDLENALNLMRQLSVADDSGAVPQWVRVEKAGADTKSKHLILLGEPHRQPWLTELNPHLPQPFDPETGALLPSYGIRIPTAVPDLGVVQLLRSPWAANRVVMVVTGTSDTGYRQAIRLLTEPALQSQLAGRLAVVAAGENVALPQVYTQSVADLTNVPAVGTVERFLKRTFGVDSPWPAVFLITAALLTLAAVAAFGAHWYHQRRGAGSDGH